MTYSMYQERALLYRTLLSFLPSTNPSATRASEWVGNLSPLSQSVVLFISFQTYWELHNIKIGNYITSMGTL